MGGRWRREVTHSPAQLCHGCKRGRNDIGTAKCSPQEEVRASGCESAQGPMAGELASPRSKATVITLLSGRNIKLPVSSAAPRADQSHTWSKCREQVVYAVRGHMEHLCPIMAPPSLARDEALQQKRRQKECESKRSRRNKVKLTSTQQGHCTHKLWSCVW